MAAPSIATSTPLCVEGILQIHTPPPPDSQTQRISLGEENADLSTSEGRDTFWQHLLDRFKLLEWERERKYAEFHLVAAQVDSSAPASREEPELSAEEATSMALRIAGHSDGGTPELSTLVLHLDGETAAALLA